MADGFLFDLPELARIAQVARALQVDPRTVRRWIADGRLDAIKLGDARTAPVRVPRGSVQRLLTVAMLRPRTAP